jgi:hypothetical protein
MAHIFPKRHCPEKRLLFTLEWQLVFTPEMRGEDRCGQGNAGGPRKLHETGAVRASRRNFNTVDAPYVGNILFP